MNKNLKNILIIPVSNNQATRLTAQMSLGWHKKQVGNALLYINTLNLNISCKIDFTMAQHGDKPNIALQV